MEAHELTIRAKRKAHLFNIVTADDFQTETGRAVDPRIVLEQPNVSLYCLDHANRCALFVDTPPETDLLGAPFYFIAQYEAARRLIAVPYPTLHALAGEAQIDPQRIILFYSTGRCGSTLLSHVLNQTPGVVSFSEPDVFTQMVAAAHRRPERRRRTRHAAGRFAGAHGRARPAAGVQPLGL